MNRKLSSLLVIGTAQCFSFNKMKISQMFIQDPPGAGYPENFYIPKNEEMHNFDKWVSKGIGALIVAYDEHSRVGISITCPWITNLQTDKTNFTLKEVRDWTIKGLYMMAFTEPYSNGYLVVCINRLWENIAKINMIENLYQTSLPEAPLKQCLKMKEGDRLYGPSLYGYYEQNHLYSNHYVSASGVNINNTVLGVIISRTGFNATTVSFQKVLSKYLKLNQNEIEKENCSQIDLDLLKNSHITSILELIPDPYFQVPEPSSSIYTQWLWNFISNNSKHDNKVEPTINHLIMGSAIDKRNKKSYFWVTDLGKRNDISVLFNIESSKPKNTFLIDLNENNLPELLKNKGSLHKVN